MSFSDGVVGEFDAAELVEWTVEQDYDVRTGPPPKWQDRAFFKSVRADADGWALHWGQADRASEEVNCYSTVAMCWDLIRSQSIS